MSYSADPGAVSANPPGSCGAKGAFGVCTLSIIRGGKGLGSLHLTQTPMGLAAEGCLPIPLPVTRATSPCLKGGPGITPLNPPWKLMWWGTVPDRAPEGELVFMSMNSENTGGGQTHNWTVREMDSSSEGSASSQGYQTPGVPPPPGHWSQKIWAQIRGKTGLPLHQGGGSWSHRTMETQAGVPPALVEKF